mmetsp:Transcript_20744/g.69296  ORF Transcript_20744/g.69296 Transcript_20744/m.69296 type:complete len:217 (-) Transcript_20744:1028-1678(-)
MQIEYKQPHNLYNLLPSPPLSSSSSSSFASFSSLLLLFLVPFLHLALCTDRRALGGRGGEQQMVLPHARHFLSLLPSCASSFRHEASSGRNKGFLLLLPVSSRPGREEEGGREERRGEGRREARRGGVKARGRARRREEARGVRGAQEVKSKAAAGLEDRPLLPCCSLGLVLGLLVLLPLLALASNDSGNGTVCFLRFDFPHPRGKGEVAVTGRDP